MTRLVCRIIRPRPFAALAALAALAAASLASSGVASAEQPSEITVHYDSKDLATEAGIRALLGHIMVAARMVCPPEDPRKLWQPATSRECQSRAIARAVARVGNQRLAAAYAHTLPRRK